MRAEKSNTEKVTTMANEDYTSIGIKRETKTRLENWKITAGEYWDDLINRILDKLEAKEVA